MSIKSPSNKWIYLCVLVPIVLGDLGRIRITEYINSNIADIIIPILLIYHFKKDQIKKNKFFRTYLYWLGAITIIFAISLIHRIGNVPLEKIAQGSLYVIRFCMYMLLPVILVPTLSNIQNRIFFSRSIVLAFIIISIAGLLQLVLFPDLKIIEYLGYDPHYYRAVSTWLDPNFLGAGLTCAILFVLAQDIQTKLVISRNEKIITLTLLLLTLLVTFSRSAYIFAALSVTLYALLRKSWKIGLGVLVCASIFLLVFTLPRAQIESTKNIDRNFSANVRLKSYGEAITFFSEHPILGVGYNLIRYERQSHQLILDTRQGGNSGAGIDSSWLLILATTGVIGFVAFLAFWVRQLYFIINTSNSQKLFYWIPDYIHSATPLQHALGALFIGWSVHAWFINSLFYPNLLILWGILLSLTVANNLYDK